MFDWYFSNPNNAAWLEAIGTILAACFAFAGIFIAWKSLKKDISEQQAQINTLVTLSENMSSQTETLTKSINIDSQILDELRKNFAQSARLAELNLDKKKLSAKPSIVVKLTGRLGATLQFAIENNGLKEANNVNIHSEVSPSLRLRDLPKEEISRLSTDNQRITFSVETSNNVQDARIKLTIDYQDIYVNNYQTNFEIIINQFNSKINKISDMEIIVNPPHP